MNRSVPLAIVGRFVEAASWVVALIVVVGAVAWHEARIVGYWRERFEDGHLFLTQRDPRRPPGAEPEPTGWYPTWLTIVRYESDLSIGLLAASAGLIVVNVARRWRVRRPWREPGAVACVVAVAAMGFCVLEEASLAIKGHRGLWGRLIENPFPNAWPHCELRISLAVLGAWAIMAGIGRWRPRRSWADRIGRVVGWLWLVVMLYRMFGSLFIPFSNWGY